MADRNRQLLVAVLLLAGVVLIGYAAFVVLQILDGSYEAGPLRLLTVVANVVTGLLALGASVYFARVKPPGG